MKWEYHIEHIMPLGNANALETKLNELGEDGWELVLCLDRNPFIFKRPNSK
jgi:hypothetical protein